MYNEFFDPPKDGEFDNPLEFAADTLDRMDHLDDEDTAQVDEEEEEEDDDDDETETETKERKKTPHEERMEKMKKKIERLEEANVAERPWEQRGEVSVHDRPQDSLLETTVEFQTASRPPPPPSRETALELTELIKRRIASETFDDVERRDPEADAAANKAPSARRIPLAEEQRRAQMSLAEVYEEEFRNRLLAAERKQQQTASSTASTTTTLESMTDEQRDVETHFRRLCAKLDALANFHFTPKRVGGADEEVTVLPNVPAIAMEEVVPVAMSRANLLAPEEIYQQQAKAPAVREEMTREERHTAHAQVKRRKHAAAMPTTAKAAKARREKDTDAAAAAEVDKAKKRGRPKEGAGRPRQKFNSRAFFAELQQAESAPPPAKRAARRDADAAERPHVSSTAAKL